MPSTFTYTGDPAASQLDELRFWTQDTDAANPLLSDEELSYLLSMWWPRTESILYTAAVACEAISAKFTSEVDISADGVSVGMSALQERYLRLAARLREQYKAEAVNDSAPILEGVVWSQEYDPTIKPLRFGIGHMDNYEAGRQDYGDFDPGHRPEGWSGGWHGWTSSSQVPAYLKVSDDAGG